MAETLTEVSVEVLADLRRLKPATIVAAKEAGDAGGEALGDGLTKGTEARVRNSRGQFVKAGESLGESLGDGITRGADGRLRDSRGKFVGAGRQAGAGFTKGIEGGFGETFAKVAATMAAKFALIGGAAAAASPGVLQLAGALAPAVGAAAALPAGLLAIKAVSATTKLAVMGVGDAITAGFGDNAKDAKKALDQLDGSARSFAEQAIALKGPISDIQKTVSNRFFLPLINEVQPLAKTLIPLLRSEMGDLAGMIGGFGEELFRVGKNTTALAAVRSIFDSTGQSLVRLRGAVQPVATAFGDLIIATAPELPKLADGFTAIAIRAAAFVSEASKTGKVTAAFEKGKQVLSDLFGVIGNVLSILKSVYDAANASGNTLLGNLRDLTGQVAAFLKSGEGMGALTATFGTLSTVGEALRTGLAAVLPAIASSLQVAGPALAGLAGPAAQLVVAIAPLLPIVVGLGAQILTVLTPAIAALAGFLAQNATAVKVAAVAITAYAVAVKVAAAASAVQAAGGFIAMAKSLTVVTNITKLASIAQIAFGAALRFATGPIGLIITGITLLVAAIVYLWKNNETFRNVVMAVWSAVKSAVASVVDWFRGTALPWLQRVWEGIADGAKWMWEKVLRPVFMGLIGYWQNVVFPVAMFLWKNIIVPVFKGISAYVKAAMAVVELAIAIVVSYIRNVVAPTYMWLWKNVIVPVFNGIKAVITTIVNAVRGVLMGIVNFVRGALSSAFNFWWKSVVTPVFNGVRSVIASVWDKIRPIFEAIGGWVRDKLPEMFRKGVDGIKAAWGKVQDAAKVPVNFVVNKVINPLIGGFNKVAGVFGTTKIDPIQGFATGGQIPGRPSLRDNMLAAVGDTGRILKVAAGEYITNTKSTLANLPLLKRINSKRGKVTRDDIDPVLDGYERGGRVGGDGIGDFMSGVWRGIKGVGNAVVNPGATLAKMANTLLSKVPGGGAFRDVVIGMARKVVDGVKGWLGKNADGGGIGGGSVAGGWRGMQRLISGKFPGLGLVSGFRPGSVTTTGNRSYHSLGRAVDYPAHRPLAAWIKSTYGAKTKELITPWQELNLWQGRPHRYTGSVWQTHNFAGGNAHVHWAAQNGGRVGRNSGIAQIARADFGSVTLKRGWNLIENATGKPEPLTAVSGNDRVEALLTAILGAVEANPRRFAGAMGATSSTLLREARRR